MTVRLFVLGLPGSGKSTFMLNKLNLDFRPSSMYDYQLLDGLLSFEEEKLLERAKPDQVEWRSERFTDFDVLHKIFEADVKRARPNLLEWGFNELSSHILNKLFREAMATLENEPRLEFEFVRGGTSLLRRIDVFRKAFNKFKLKIIQHIRARLKKLIQIQYIASQIQNKIARSPTLQKKEPPIGGVKVGGEKHDRKGHVARTLYLAQNLNLAA